MGGTLTVTPHAQRVASSTGKAIFISNTGLLPIYLSSTQDVTPGNSHASIGAGGSVQWPGGENLYVCCDAGVQGSLSYLDNGAVVNSGSQLAQQSNQPVLLTSGTFHLTGATGFFTGVLGPADPFYDVSQFASIILSLVCSAGSNMAVNIVNYLVAGIFQYDENQNTLNPACEVDGTSAEWFVTNGMNEDTMYLQVPVVGHYAIFNANVVIGQVTSAGDLTNYIFGSYEAVPRKKYKYGQPFTLLPGKPSQQPVLQSFTNVGSVSNWVESEEGDAILAAIKAVSTTAATYVKSVLNFSIDGQILGPIATAVTPLVAQEASTAVAVKLPFYPVQLTTTYNGTTTTGVSSLTQ